MLRDNTDEAFDLLRMALTSPHFDTAHVERIRSQVISGLRRDTTYPTGLASRNLLEVTFGDHPHGRQASGTLDSVLTHAVADLKDYVGVLVKDTAECRARRRRRPGHARQAARPKLRQPAGQGEAHPGCRCRGGQASGARLRAAQRAAGRDHLRRPRRGAQRPNFMAAYVLNHILGGGRLSSRLYREVSEKAGFAYSMFESLLWMEHSVVFIGITSTRADRSIRQLVLGSAVAVLACSGPTSRADVLRYPFAAAAPKTDRYGSTEVEDPYRWLEDDIQTAPEYATGSKRSIV